MNTNIMTSTHLIARRIAATVRLKPERNGSPKRKRSVTLNRWEVSSLAELIRLGGPEQFIDAAVTQAAREARVTEAKDWLEALEAARPQIEAIGELTPMVWSYNEYIKTLRRLAGEFTPTPADKERVRAQTRERVRRLRARRKLKADV